MTIPSLTQWSEEDVPDETALNANWRDGLRWLLGYDTPGFCATSTDTTWWTINTWNFMTLNTEWYKQGGMSHATDSQYLYVPEDGVYEGIYIIEVDCEGAGTGWYVYSGLICSDQGVQIEEITTMKSLSYEYDNIYGMQGYSLRLTAGSSVRIAAWPVGAPASTIRNKACAFSMWWVSR